MTRQQASPQREHGGDLAAAMTRYGGDAADWLDLSTGINPTPYPIDAALARAPSAWTRLPGADREAALIDAARTAYGADPRAETVAAAGAQALIQLTPTLAPAGPLAVVSPTYNEHAGAARDAGREVLEVSAPDQAPDAPTLIVTNPNNPDGRQWSSDALLAQAARRRLLIVDESFADVAPEASIAAHAGADTVLAMRSFGKFYGLAGVRLGFAITGPVMAARLRRRLGPWAVSGPALEIGVAALSDRDWSGDMRRRLAEGAQRLDAIAARVGWRLVGGTNLFRLYDVGDAAAVREQLAARRIWTRSFKGSPSWLRLGQPGDDDAWDRLAAALEAS